VSQIETRSVCVKNKENKKKREIRDLIFDMVYLFVLLGMSQILHLLFKASYFETFVAVLLSAIVSLCLYASREIRRVSEKIDIEENLRNTTQAIMKTSNITRIPDNALDEKKSRLAREEDDDEREKIIY
jgi:hypothetical protein